MLIRDTSPPIIVTTAGDPETGRRLAQMRTKAFGIVFRYCAK
jgi:hypothetical protein